MPSKYRQLLPPLIAGSAMLGLAILASSVDMGRGRTGEAQIAAGLADAEATEADGAMPGRRHRRHSLNMPYFSFAQSLRPRN